MKRNVVAWAALVVSTAALVSSQTLTRTVPAAPKMPAESQKTARALSDAFAAVAEFSKPSVVQISVQRKGVAQGHGRGLPPGLPRGNMNPKDLEDFLNELQKRFNGPGFGPEPQQFGGIALGTGSGFVYDDQGHILTNNHVVSNAGKIVVKFHDGVEAPARVVGTDPKSDVAVIKVDNTSYPPLPRGVSSKVRVGELVLAVGSPFGLSQTVTLGIVSATERNDLRINDQTDAYESFLQTDAPINPGNSGGPLLNTDGKVVGINSAIMSGGRSGFGGGGGNDGVGFAIPIDMASNIAGKLIKDGKVSRARIGVAIGTMSPAEAKILGIDPKIKGALVQAVVPDSPADKAGLQQGDVIVSFDNHPVLSVSTFRLNVAASEIGKPYPLKYYRSGTEHSAEVVLGSADSVVFEQEKEAAAEEAPAKPKEAPKTAISDFGLEVQPLTEELAKGLDLKGTQGLLITSVKDDSPASAKGLKPGMVITQVIKDKQLQAIKGVKEFQELSETSDDLMIYIKSNEIPGAFVTLSKLKKD